VCSDGRVLCGPDVTERDTGGKVRASRNSNLSCAGDSPAQKERVRREALLSCSPTRRKTLAEALGVAKQAEVSFPARESALCLGSIGRYFAPGVALRNTRPSRCMDMRSERAVIMVLRHARAGNQDRAPRSV